ncbi:MAG: hypothetical protein AAFX99_31955 [Myxococcota bacterium]
MSAPTTPILGICGGCQMLGEAIEDPYGIESQEARVAGLGLLGLTTCFGPDKRVTEVMARGVGDHLLAREPDSEGNLSGYEIHMGRIEAHPGVEQPFAIVTRDGQPQQAWDGAVGQGGAVVGTMIHGILHNPQVRATLISTLRRRRGWDEVLGDPSTRGMVDPMDRLADAVEQALDMEQLRRLIGL